MLVDTVWANGLWADIWQQVWASSGLQLTWTVQENSSDSWSTQANSSDTWTVQTESTDTWAEQ
jgi:hypothetical protein